MFTVRPAQQHKRTESTASGRKISFNLENTIYPITPARSQPLNPELRIEMPSPQADFQNVPSPFARSNAMRIEYKRALSTSTKTTDRHERAKIGHRRTQSCTTPSSCMHHQPRKSSTDLKRMPYNRSSSNIANSREYYAAPAYNEASLLERKESLRNSVRVKNVVEQLDYQASSPDEKALVEGCAKVGFIYTGESKSLLNVKLQYQRVSYLVLNHSFQDKSINFY